MSAFNIEHKPGLSKKYSVLDGKNSTLEFFKLRKELSEQWQMLANVLFM